MVEYEFEFKFFSDRKSFNAVIIIINAIKHIALANAVMNTINGEIGEGCPATALRKHESAVLYLDGDSSALLSL